MDTLAGISRSRALAHGAIAVLLMVAAMPGQPVSGVLDARAALHPALEKVSGLSGNGEDRRKNKERFA